ncbi:Dyp-type peroxidase [Sinorhizobium medicae]|uniref:Dyp-type peroxidase n=1 Tax=Sinorhizobium medicae TaxID=110321 RepID=UPI000FD6E770|nr:hypothetical protein [Sinorhizobium medicae]RVJ72543.1 hypothetical protein CN168_26750 [Sinorhizobium medicae]
MTGIDRSDVQALILVPYKRPISRHLLFSIDRAEGARRFVAALLPHITFGTSDDETKPLLNLSMTWQGLLKLGAFDALGGPHAAEQAFPWHFKERPDPDSLRIAGPSSPETWWNGNFDGDDIHLILHVYANADAEIEARTAAVRAAAAENGLTELLPTRTDEAITGRALTGRQLHFGYQDGISHPDVNWDDLLDRPDLLPKGMFVIDEWLEEHQSFPRDPPFRNFVRNGSYMAFVWIYQDVATFRRFLRETGPVLRPDLSSAAAQEWLAAKLMGRWRSGAPLAATPEVDDQDRAMENDFSYGQDKIGTRCPFAAHIRIVNGRDQPLNAANRAMFPGGFPRVLRRGTPYGAELKGEDDDGMDRGVVGMFLCANLNQQFYSLTRWMGKTDFSDVYTDTRGQDPLTGERAFPHSSSEFEIPMANGIPLKLRGLPQFIRLQGVALCLLPSASTLRDLARN